MIQFCLAQCLVREVLSKGLGVVKQLHGFLTCKAAAFPHSGRAVVTTAVVEWSARSSLCVSDFSNCNFMTPQLLDETDKKPGWCLIPIMLSIFTPPTPHPPLSASRTSELGTQVGCQRRCWLVREKGMQAMPMGAMSSGEQQGLSPKLLFFLLLLTTVAIIIPTFVVILFLLLLSSTRIARVFCNPWWRHAFTVRAEGPLIGTCSHAQMRSSPELHSLVWLNFRQLLHCLHL